MLTISIMVEVLPSNDAGEVVKSRNATPASMVSSLTKCTSVKTYQLKSVNSSLPSNSTLALELDIDIIPQSSHCHSSNGPLEKQPMAHRIFVANAAVALS
jgi:hypothetical protein